MLDRLKEWWQGDYVEPSLEQILDREDDGEGRFDRPWIVRVIVSTSGFIKKEWKWLLGFSLSAAAVYIAYLKL